MKIITIIDLGSNKIAAATAGIDKCGKVSLSALENLCSRGIKGGEITDIDKATEDISSVVDRLRRRGGGGIKNVFVTGKTADIKMHTSRGMVPLSKIPRKITRNDVEKCLKIAAMTRLPSGRAIMQRIVKGFSIDGGSFVVADPMGLYGVKLEVEAFMATTTQSKIQNITKCIDRAGLLLNGIYLSGIACAESVLDEEEKEKGVLLLDIGDSLTEQLIFKKNTLMSFNVIRNGAGNISDCAAYKGKERIRELLKDVLPVLPAENRYFSSVVLTGGGALLDGIIEEAEDILERPARIGRIKDSGWNLNLQNSIIHTSTIGLINHLAKKQRTTQPHGHFINKVFCKVRDIYESYF
ncbi:MAG: hypothetical protein A2Z72_06555 [Omnitrophica bacterium RBG_13_46_9]|nr:MAG: hypothetical protein A2Z72_06555 [Omnitrophica bacterium RBG_13_46_9]